MGQPRAAPVAQPPADPIRTVPRLGSLPAFLYLKRSIKSHQVKSNQNRHTGEHPEQVSVPYSCKFIWRAPQSSHRLPPLLLPPLRRPARRCRSRARCRWWRATGVRAAALRAATSRRRRRRRFRGRRRPLFTRFSSPLLLISSFSMLRSFRRWITRRIYMYI